MKKLIYLFMFLLILHCQGYAQEKSYKVACIAFYNTENLFDTLNDPAKNDEEFTPQGSNQWTSARYLTKLDRLSEVISQIGNEYVKGGPVLIGLSEIENISVLQDLSQTTLLKNSGYVPVLLEGPDVRGVDVGFMYRKDYFTLLSATSKRLVIPGKEDFFTRDQLMVKGIVDGDTLFAIVNHWPSRRGGEKRSAPLRFAAAQLVRSTVDSILNVSPNAKIIIMGDLNDNPTDASVMKGLRAAPDKETAAVTKLYNPMYEMYKKRGLGSHAYRDHWSMLDQTIVSSGLLGDDKSSFKFYGAFVFNRPFLTQKEGTFSGYPLRTYVGSTFMGGYSDHFPVYLFLIKERK